MADLETDAQPFVTPLILGQPVSLDRAQQELVALWALKTGMTGQYVLERHVRAIPREHLRYVYDHRQPPPTCQVWILGYGGEPLNTSIHMKPHWTIGAEQSALDEHVVEPIPQPDTYTATLAIHRFVFVLLGYVAPGKDLVLRKSLPPGPSQKRIWPPQGDKVTWPFKRPLRSEQELRDYGFAVADIGLPPLP